MTNTEHILVPNPFKHEENDESTLLGKWARVRIVAVSKFHMLSEIVAIEEEKDEEKNVGKCTISKLASKNEVGMIGDRALNNNPQQMALLRWAIAGLAMFLTMKFLISHFLNGLWQFQF